MLSHDSATCPQFYLCRLEISVFVVVYVLWLSMFYQGPCHPLQCIKKQGKRISLKTIHVFILSLSHVFNSKLNIRLLPLFCYFFSMLKSKVPDKLGGNVLLLVANLFTEHRRYHMPNLQIKVFKW